MEKQYKYLGILERALDPSQENVCFTTENSVVAAGAGSGKTQVLATRFAWLVISQKVEVSEILTLTFTDKAASEMYQRIYATLKYFAEYTPKTDAELVDFFKNKRKIENPSSQMIQEFREAEQDLTEDKKALAKKALLNFTDAHIQTLDSYCGSVVRQCANRYGISPDFSVGSTDAVRTIKDKAFKFVLKYINELCVREYAEPGKIQEFAEDFLASPIIGHTSIATPEGFFSSNFEHQTEIIVSAWNEMLCGTESNPNRLSKCIRNIEDSIEVSKGKDDPKKQPWLAGVRDFLEFGNEIWPKFRSIDSEYLRQNLQEIKEQGSLAEEFFIKAKQCSKATGGIKDVKTAITAETEAIKAEFYAIYAFIKKYEEQKSMMEFYDQFLSEVNQEKRTSNALTFTDVTELALKVLLENEDIRNNEKNSYKKIMIDEFQDNNSKNRDLLYLLSIKRGEFESKPGEEQCVINIDSSNPESLHDLIAGKRDPEKLFFVGDEKQSIYKFRNADVSVFNRLTQENRQIFMNYNYRSAPELIKAFNEFFKNENGIFLSQNEASSSDFEAYYSKDAEKNGMPELPELTGQNVPLHVRFINEKYMNSDPETASFYIPKKEQVAYGIAREIYKIAEKEFAGLPKSQWKWENFAILDKSRASRGDIIKYLSLFNIPFQLDQFKNIFEEGVINDFCNFLRICVYPSDSTAFASYLCSPFCGLLENSVEMILAHLTDTRFRPYDASPFVFNPFDRRYDEEIKNDLPEREFEKFVSARNEFESYRKTVLQQEITRTLSELWHKKGYKYETMLVPNARLCAEHFDMIFELARICEQDGKNVSWFIDELANLKRAMTSSDSDLDAANVKYPLERSHAVQIMTIHKSKGLQFEHVFVLGCTNLRKDNKQGKYYYSENTGLSLDSRDSSMNYFKLIEKNTEEQKELAEFRRVVYVAITRAIKDSYIFGRIDETDRSSTEYRLIHNMVYRFYPEAESQIDYALENPVFEAGSPFDYQELEPVTYGNLPKNKENTDEIRMQTVENMQKNVIVKEPFDPAVHGMERLQPSKLESGAVLAETFRSGRTDSFGRLTEILRKYNPEPEDWQNVENYYPENTDELDSRQFSWTDYGNLVHDYLCKMVQGIDIECYQPAKKYFKNLEDDDRQEIMNQCLKMCENFKKSELYAQLMQAVQAGRFVRPEYEFKFCSQKKMYRGSIDLIFENAGGTYSLVDYKTDRSVIPEIHAAQQDCYRRAAVDILPHPGKINCYLYYLRFEEAVPLHFAQ